MNVSKSQRIGFRSYILIYTIFISMSHALRSSLSIQIPRGWTPCCCNPESTKFFEDLYIDTMQARKTTTPRQTSCTECYRRKQRVPLVTPI
ncbi:hypothetical protein B0J14DRAFT_601253 [Halenospora varia]|nr:hypothetical protein B0J14DRAFT_601253 [Halenospora varia]